jgi:hypothetical protein
MKVRRGFLTRQKVEADDLVCNLGRDEDGVVPAASGEYTYRS